MKLKEYRVREFRSVWDSGPISIADVTCLVGKNEAGKTALLKALYRLNPLVAEDSKFDVTDDYPRREVGNYNHEIASKERKPTVVVEARFELSLDDTQAVADVFGIPRALRAIEEVLQKRPLKKGEFGHFRPARYFLEHLGVLAPKLSQATKERFEKAFVRLNALLA